MSKGIMIGLAESLIVGYMLSIQNGANKYNYKI